MENKIRIPIQVMVSSRKIISLLKKQGELSDTQNFESLKAIGMRDGKLTLFFDEYAEDGVRSPGQELFLSTPINTYLDEGLISSNLYGELVRFGGIEFKDILLDTLSGIWESGNSSAINELRGLLHMKSLSNLFPVPVE